MNAMMQVDFHGEPVWAAEEDGNILVAVKPICDALGIGWEAQRQRIQRDAILSEGTCVIQAPSPGGPQETVCLRLGLLNGWLFGIDERRLAEPEAREKVLTYKRECHDVLFAHFYARAAEATGEPAAVEAMPEIDVWRLWLQLIAQVRPIWGRGAAREMWQRSPLPQPREAECGEDLVAGWLGNAMEPAEGKRTALATVTAVYNASHKPKDRLTVRQMGQVLRSHALVIARAWQSDNSGQAKCLMDWRFKEAV